MFASKNRVCFLVVQSLLLTSTAQNFNSNPSKHEDEEHFDTGRYKFAYGVEDHKTGDFKVHQEERDGDMVKGEYTVADADGTLRTVKYTADKDNGFHVVISKAGNPHREVIPAHSPQSNFVSPLAPKVPVAKSRLSDSATVYSSNIPMQKYFPETTQVSRRQNIRPTEKQSVWHQKLILDHIQRNKDEALAKAILSRITPTPAPYKHWEMTQNVPEFHLQVPQGFKKSDDITTTCRPSSKRMQHSEEQVDEQTDEMAEPNSNSNNYNGIRYQEYDVDEPEWRKDFRQAQQGESEIKKRVVHSFKNAFDENEELFRRPADKNNQGAFSYMNYEGETSSGYQLRHDFQTKRKKSRQYDESAEI